MMVFAIICLQAMMYLFFATIGAATNNHGSEALIISIVVAFVPNTVCFICSYSQWQRSEKMMGDLQKRTYLP